MDLRNPKIIRHFLSIIPIILIIVITLTYNLSLSTNSKSSAYMLSVDGAIGPAMSDHITKGLNKAHNKDAKVVIIRINTPGGLDASMRKIVSEILQSTVPIVTWVSPAGSRAASAGTYILYASHIAAMSPSTNLGAATPVQFGSNTQSGEPGKTLTPIERVIDALKNPDKSNDESTSSNPEQDLKSEPENNPSNNPVKNAPLDSDKIKSNKVINDAVAYIKGLADRYGRNAEWAELAVREGASLTAEDALENNVIDIIASNLPELLSGIDGREVQMDWGKKVLKTSDLNVIEIETDWRTNFLSIITNPTVAYILMMLGIYGLILEGYNPGTFVPGVTGGICLILALYAFQILPVNYAGLLLILLGLALIAAEMFAPSFGILGIGGIISLILGSFILLDIGVPGFSVNKGLIAGISFGSALVFGAIIWHAARTLRRPKAGSLTIIGHNAEAISDFIDGSGRVHILGEDWSARSTASISKGQNVRIKDIDSEKLVLIVEPLPETNVSNT